MIEKAMIMSAGVGSRLDPLTRNVPKPLVTLANIPTMDILLNHISKHGIKKVIANTHYLGEQIQTRYLKEESPVDVEFSYIHEETLSGTAGGVKKCQFFFNKGEKFIVMSADGLTDLNIREAIKSHEKSGCIATIVAKIVDMAETTKFGVIVTNSDGIVTEFQEKPPLGKAKSNLVNTGIYIFDYEIFNYIPENVTYDFAKNVFANLLAANISINTYTTEDYWSDIGSISQYIESTNDIINNKINIPGLEIIETPYAKIAKGTGAIIEEGAVIKGNCVIGNNSRIAKNATIKDSIIWDNVTIGENTIIENSVIASNSEIRSTIKNKIIESDSKIQDAYA